MKNKSITVKEAMEMIPEGSTLMIGGFMSCGTPERLMDALVESGKKNFTVIANDSGVPQKGIGKLISAHSISHLMASHIGLNPETGNQMVAGELQVTLIPQGTLAEQIRGGGAGLGGILTPTGVGTEVEQGKETFTIDGKDYLLEKPLRADVALIRGSVVDTIGNVYYRATTKNFNACMATAADLVIVEAEKVVDLGELDPDLVMTPSIFVDYIIGGKSDE